MNSLTVLRPGIGRPEGRPGKIIRLPGGLVQALFHALHIVHKDGNPSRAIEIVKRRSCDAQGYRPANSGAAGEKPFAFPPKAVSSSASKLPSHTSFA